MAVYEYKVVPAPRRGQRKGDNKGTAGRFANAMAGIMNEQAADGWEYLRAESLPAEEGGMMRKKVEVFQNVLVFRKPVEIDMTGYELDEEAEDSAMAEEPEPVPELEPAPAAEPQPEALPEPDTAEADPVEDAEIISETEKA